MPMKWAELDPPATDAECAAWPTPRLIYLSRRRAAKDARKLAGPMHALRMLAYREPGESVLLTQYVRGSQASPLIREVNIATGAELSTHVERSLVDDSVTGVRITLTARATRGKAPAGAEEKLPGPIFQAT